MSEPKLPWTKRRFDSVAAAGASNVIIPFPLREPDARQVAKRVGLDSFKRRSLTAAAARIDRDQMAKTSKGVSWQNEAWAAYEQVGELSYAANAHANGVSRLVLELVRTDDDGGDVKLNDIPDSERTPGDLLAIQAIKDLQGDSPSGLSELQRMAALNMFIAGEAMLVGMMPTDANDSDTLGTPQVVIRTESNVNDPDADYSGPLTSLTWRIYSPSEIKTVGNSYTISGNTYSEDEVVLIRLWNPHPRNSLIPDSRVRSSMPVLRELIGLTMHVSATIDSRMAGAGALFVPASVYGATAQNDLPEEDTSVDPVTEQLLEAMTTPIRDRDSASAVVPLVISVPDEAPWQPYHMTFSTPFDAATKELRDEAIRRLALGLDMPPEVLLGVGDSSHWNAWQVQEDNVRTHIVPVGQRLCDSLTREYLRPVLLESGLNEEQASAYSLTPDANNLIDRPNRADEALALYRIGALTQGALLDASGFRAEDSPSYGADAAIQFAIQMVMEQPSLAISIGLDKLVDQLRAAFSGIPGQPIPAIDPEHPDAEGMLDPNAPELPAEKPQVIPRESIQGPPGSGPVVDPG